MTSGTANQVGQSEIAFTVRSLRCAIVEHAIVPSRIVFSCAGKHDRSRYLIVAIASDDAVGYGEAACVPIWSGETAESARHVVEAILGPALCGRSFPGPESLCDELDHLLVDNPFLKGAIDTAAWDMVARARGVSVAKLAGDRNPVERLPVRASIGAHGVEQTVALAREFWSMGVRTLKFKTGLDTAADARRLAAVREALGDEPILTVDYNGGLPTADVAAEAIRAILPFRLALVEQPTPRHRLAMMAEVRRRVEVPILADEGVFHRAQLDEAIELGAMDMLSLYPGKNGGFTRSRQMAQTAQAAGIPCVIGSNLETEVGQAAMGCLAACLTAFPVERHACDLLSAMYYEHNPLTPIRPLDDGCYVVPTGAGFGVDVRWPNEAGA